MGFTAGETTTELANDPLSSSSKSSSTTPTISTGTAFVTTSASTSKNISPSAASVRTQSTSGFSSGSTSNSGTIETGVSIAEAAGIGVGCAVVGALLAFMIGYLFFRKREKSHYRRRSSRTQRSNAGFVSDKETATAVVAPRPTIDDDLDRLLPQEADDNTVRKKAATLFDQLELHVENYYRDVKVSITPTMESELSRFSSPHLSEPLVAFLNSTSRPRELIKHSLAFYVISLTSAAGESTRSLLPLEIVEMVRASSKRKTTPESGLAFSRWKMLTAYLRPELLSDTGATNAQPDRALEEAVQSFSRVFAPWAKPDVPDSERVKNLSDIVDGAVRFSMWLFSQPSNFKYDWKPLVDVRDRANRTVIIIPGLLKVTDNRGQALARPLSVVTASRSRV